MTDPSWRAPLTESQAGLLVVHRTVAVPHLYNVVAEVRLDPAHRPDEVRWAVAAALAAQPALRIALREVPEPHAMLIDPPDVEDLPLRQIAVPDLDPAVRRELDTLATTAFDLGQAPLLRAVHLHSPAGSALLLVVHHTVFDGYSLQPLLRDLDAALAGRLKVDQLRPERERALLREVRAQLRVAAGPEVEKRAGQLGARLRAVPATTLYPRPNRPLNTSFTGVRRTLPLSPEQSARIDQAIRRLGITPFGFFSAVYATVLARHGGGDTVTFGSPLLARRTVASYDLCGFFVNTLPLVVEVDWTRTFARYVEETIGPEVDRVRRAVDVPFHRVVRHADPDRSGNRNPLFSAMLAMQDSTVPPPGSAIREVREHGTGTAKFDLWLGVTPAPNGWLLEVEYDTDLLPEPVADGIAGSLRQAVDRAAGDVNVRLAELFDDASTEETFRTDGYRRQPARRELDGWLAETAGRCPDAVAVEEDGSRLTYRELTSLVARVAAGLRRRGVVPGQVVGLSTETLSDTVVAILAVLRLRAVFLPLDLSLPTDRLAYMTDKADCRLVVGVGRLDVPVVSLDRSRPDGLADAGMPDASGTARDVDAAGVGGGPGDADGTGVTTTVPAAVPGVTSPAPGTAADGVYVMFTSGSTGRPKGVLMHHRPLVNLTAWQLAALEMAEDTRFLQYAPLGFDVSFQEIIPTLAAGGTVVSRDPVDRRDLPALAHRVRDTRVTHVYLPVAALRPFVQAAQALTFPDLRYVCVSGEQLTVDDLVRQFFVRHPGLRLVNLYGPTETHAVTTHRLTGDDPEWPGHVPIGLPLTGVTAQVVDRTGHLAPRGVVGELSLGGECPARGYINDPERTAERFVPDPYGTVRYRTGDQVMWDDSGVLVFLGRDDHQVKIRGYRVELGEVETAAQKHPDVRRAVAVARSDGAERHLVLFVVAELDDPDRLRRHLADVLPGYMVPARVLAIDSVPLTGNGKVDRSALLKLADRLVTAEPGTDSGPAALSDDPLRARLQQMWAELLGQPVPPVDRSLLELGAHSLNVLTAAALIEREHQVRIPILDFFRAPTVAALADLIRAEAGDRR